MMWHEFEQIAGYEVSFETYSNIIEPMYMAICDQVATKQDFVKMLDKKAFALPSPASLLREVKKEANHLFDICGHYTDYESEQRMEKAAKAYAKRKFGFDWANDLQVYVFFNREYEYPEIKRGCTYPVEMVIGRGDREAERVTLIK